MGWASKMAKIFLTIVGLFALVLAGGMLLEDFGGSMGEQRNCIGSVFAGKAPDCNTNPNLCMKTWINGKIIGNVYWDGNNFRPC